MAKRVVERLNTVSMLVLSGGCLFISFLMGYVLPRMGITFDIGFDLAWISFLLSGSPLIYLAVHDTLEKRITSPLLITIAMLASIYIGDIFAAGEIAFIMAIGEWLEDRTVEKAKKGMEKLLDLVPVKGRRLTDGKEVMVDSHEIKIGDILRVLPGESLPSDGMIIEGMTTIDQSILTGESLPIDKVEGDEVFAGTINRYGSVDIRVTKSFQDSSLQKMIQLVEKAEQNQAPLERLVDKWAGYLVPTACVIAIITYLVFAYGLQEPDVALVRGVTILVVFCPCALALATPTSIMAAIGQATKQGVLIKSGEALEKMGTVSVIAFDKTGTLTKGKLVVTNQMAYHCEEQRLMEVIASVEKRSEHPLGQAIVKYGREKQIALLETTEFSMVVGKGVMAKIEGICYYCGNERLMNEYTKVSITDEMTNTIRTLREEGKAVIIVATAENVMGLVALSDEIKETVKEAVETLQKSGITNNVLLTGDNEQSANFVANQVGIVTVYSSLLPEDKVHYVRTLMEEHQGVCMMGDGVNDAPAIKTATVGVAMGTMGSDIAIDASDIAIMGDDISKIAYIKKLSNATIFSIQLNIILAMSINLTAIVLSVTGLLTPTTGALVHNAGSVLVVFNAARLYDKKI